MATEVFATKDPAEIQNLAFDFSPHLGSETRTGALQTSGIEVLAGTDASPSNVLNGAPILSGTLVVQSVKAGSPELASAVRARSATLAPMSTQLPLRVAWRGFPDVEIIASESAVKQNPHYAPAKAGDRHSAHELVREAFTDAKAKSFASTFSDPQSIRWLPVAAIEAEGVNRIPAALAERLASKIGGSVWENVVQSNSVGHTGATGWARLARPALFEGDVLAGERYVLADDFIGQGGTLANLRGHVEAKGGVAVGAVSLTGQARSATVRLSKETLIALQSKHGHALENLWQNWFGYGLGYLTESEARYLLRAEDVDTIRNRIVAARP